MGSQINKSTNKEACRNLSGRRMRDINAEKKSVNIIIILLYRLLKMITELVEWFVWQVSKMGSR